MNKVRMFALIAQVSSARLAKAFLARGRRSFTQPRSLNRARDAAPLARPSPR